jgi:hypothetical protein
MFLSFLGGLLYRYNQYYLQWIWSNSLTYHNPSFALSPCLNPASRPVCRGVDAQGHLNQLLKKISVSHQKLIGHRLVRQLICLILVELKKWINWSLIGQWVTSGKNCVLLSLLSLFSRIKIVVPVQFSWIFHDWRFWPSRKKTHDINQYHVSNHVISCQIWFND